MPTDRWQRVEHLFLEALEQPARARTDFLALTCGPDAALREEIESLLQAGATVQVYDPEAMGVAKKLFGNRVTYAEANYGALKGADGLAIVTEWNEFRRPDFERMR